MHRGVQTEGFYSVYGTSASSQDDLNLNCFRENTDEIKSSQHTCDFRSEDELFSAVRKAR